MQVFAPNQCTEATDLSGSIRERQEEAEEEDNPVGELAVSINLDPQILRYLRYWNINHAAYTSCYEAPNTYRVEDSWVCVLSEKMHLTL